MAFFQNPCDQEFRGIWFLGDAKYSVEYDISRNRNSSDYQLCYNIEPYDLSVSNTLTINYAYDDSLKAFSALSINIAGASPAATKASEIVTILNSNATFSDMWIASLYKDDNTVNQNSVLIKRKSGRVKQNVRTYISNSGAETKLGFNKHARVAELPDYMERHTIANRFNYPDSQGLLVLLDTGNSVDQAIITAAGFDYTSPKSNWELLAGRSGAFQFEKITLDGLGRTTQIIEFPAGSVVGNLAKLIQFTYTGGNTMPDQITEIPYVLQSGDLISP